MRRAESIAAVSGKGGTGKTLLLASLGYALQRAGHKVLFVDTDLATDGLSLFLLGPAGEKMLEDSREGRLYEYLREFNSQSGDIGFIAIHRGEQRDHGMRYEAVITGSDIYGNDRVDWSRSPEPPLERAVYRDAFAKLFELLKKKARWDYILVDTRGGFSFATTDVIALCDSFFLVTEPQLSSIDQNVSLVARIERAAQELGTKPMLRGVIVNKATEGFAPTRGSGNILRPIDLDRIEGEYRTILARQLEIDYKSETHPIPIDIEAVRAYKDQTLPYRTAPGSLFSFSSLMAFKYLLRVVGNQWQADRAQEWSRLVDDVSTAIEARNIQLEEELERELDRVNELTSLRGLVQQRSEIEERYKREIAEYSYRLRSSDRGRRRLIVALAAFVILPIVCFPVIIYLYISQVKSIPVEARIYGDLISPEVSLEAKSSALQTALRLGLSLGGAKLNSIDLKGAALSNVDLVRSDLRGALLDEADLRGAILRNSNLAGASLRYAKLAGSDLKNADLTAANLQEAQLAGADLRDSVLRTANLAGADLARANLSGADLTEAAVSKEAIRQATTDNRTRLPASYLDQGSKP